MHLAIKKIDKNSFFFKPNFYYFLIPKICFPLLTALTLRQTILDLVVLGFFKDSFQIKLREYRYTTTRFFISYYSDFIEIRWLLRKLEWTAQKHKPIEVLHATHSGPIVPVIEFYTSESTKWFVWSNTASHLEVITFIYSYVPETRGGLVSKDNRCPFHK